MEAGEGPFLRGKRCLLTGASSGIGLATARILARLGAELILVGRDAGRTEAARRLVLAQLSEGAPGPRVELAELSLMREVAALAERVASQGPLDLLINCAGIFTPKRRMTAEGLETQLAVNHLAPFLLTNRLLPALQAAPEARVVTVSSDSHYFGKIHWRDPSLGLWYVGLRAYAQSKLANVLFSGELARRLGPDSSLTILSEDPGLVNTEMGRKQGPSLSGLVWGLRKRGGTSPELPAEEIAYLAAEPSLRGRTGLYWRAKAEKLPSRRARDPEAARRLWELSEALVEAALGRAAPEPSPGLSGGLPRS